MVVNCVSSSTHVYPLALLHTYILLYVSVFLLLLLCAGNVAADLFVQFGLKFATRMIKCEGVQHKTLPLHSFASSLR